ncbi:unnamed protein product [Oppiella nova]|uniref:Methyltransferase type 11 domain-containing protein n=1 Tax=Oppiella nova TaxID=334625 RepID=A0A7R9LD57_9ACAR|nr:unnamed protein product [Oppiella nova]CAG2162371.1 unnamed protein product [Oppiella nova]
MVIKLGSLSERAKHTVILEIGPARGNNFEFYPSNCRIIALDYNSYFEKYFRQNKSKFPNILCEDFVNGMAEDMRQIEDNSVDVVVATYVLCSVKDRNKTLREIRRVLKKGGTIMKYLVQPMGVWSRFVYHDKHYVNDDVGKTMRKDPPTVTVAVTWSHIERAGFHTLHLNYEYPNEMVFIARAHIWGTATTHETDEFMNKD